MIRTGNAPCIRHLSDQICVRYDITPSELVEISIRCQVYDMSVGYHEV